MHGNGTITRSSNNRTVGSLPPSKRASHATPREAKVKAPKPAPQQQEQQQQQLPQQPRRRRRSTHSDGGSSSSSSNDDDSVDDAYNSSDEAATHAAPLFNPYAFYSRDGGQTNTAAHGVPAPPLPLRTATHRYLFERRHRTAFGNPIHYHYIPDLATAAVAAAAGSTNASRAATADVRAALLALAAAQADAARAAAWYLSARGHCRVTGYDLDCNNDPCAQWVADLAARLRNAVAALVRFERRGVLLAAAAAAATVPVRGRHHQQQRVDNETETDPEPVSAAGGFDLRGPHAGWSRRTLATVKAMASSQSRPRGGVMVDGCGALYATEAAARAAYLRDANTFLNRPERLKWGGGSGGRSAAPPGKAAAAEPVRQSRIKKMNCDAALRAYIDGRLEL
ncbi:hypothetical protein DFJ73DRAFT_814711 [Zopfochytrium polystomum]|nr:hypothetical protein DFJ73DRAFT_814711 [Zopfochytrium polystomum]